MHELCKNKLKTWYLLVIKFGPGVLDKEKLADRFYYDAKGKWNPQELIKLWQTLYGNGGSLLLLNLGWKEGSEAIKIFNKEIISE